MAFSPETNQSYGSLSFSSYGYGDVPVTAQFPLAALASGKNYSYCCLLGKNADGTISLYNSAATGGNSFAGVLFDETADYSALNAGGNFASIAIASRPSTLFLASNLVGFSSGATDLNALVTAGVASIITFYENGQAIQLVKFNAMTVGGSYTPSVSGE